MADVLITPVVSRRGLSFSLSTSDFDHYANQLVFVTLSTTNCCVHTIGTTNTTYIIVFLTTTPLYKGL